MAVFDHEKKYIYIYILEHNVEIVQHATPKIRFDRSSTQVVGARKQHNELNHTILIVVLRNDKRSFED